MVVTVREAALADLGGLAAIENSGDRMFRKIGIRCLHELAPGW